MMVSAAAVTVVLATVWVRVLGLFVVPTVVVAMVGLHSAMVGRHVDEHTTGRTKVPAAVHRVNPSRDTVACHGVWFDSLRR